MSVPGKRGPRASLLKSVLSVAGTPREQSNTERQSQRSFKSNLEHSRSHSFGGNNRGTRISAPGLERRRSTQYGNNRGTVSSRWAWPESVLSVAGTPREELLRNARVKGHLNGIRFSYLGRLGLGPNPSCRSLVHLGRNFYGTPESEVI